MVAGVYKLLSACVWMDARIVLVSGLFLLRLVYIPCEERHAFLRLILPVLFSSFVFHLALLSLETFSITIYPAMTGRTEH